MLDPANFLSPFDGRLFKIITVIVIILIVKQDITELLEEEARGQQVKQVETRVWAVLHNGSCPAGAARVINALQGGERAADDRLCCVNNSLKPPPVHFSGMRLTL